MKQKKIKKIPLIIDTDPGCDDALALITLFKHIDNFDLKLICSTAGNIPIDITTRNVQFFAQNFFTGVKVAKGVANPLVKNCENIDAANVHGMTGMGNFDPGKQNYPYEKDSAKAMYDILLESKEPVTIISLGPLTNIARLFITYPDSKKYIKEIYSMIGSTGGHGNVTKYSEFNAFFDPEAFDIVAKSSVKIIFNTIELAEDARLPKERVLNKKPRDLTEKLILDIISGMTEVCDPESIFMYDSNSVVAVIKPDLYDFIPCDVTVTTTIEEGGKCTMVANPEGKHYFQKIKNVNRLNAYLMKNLFER